MATLKTSEVMRTADAVMREVVTCDGETWTNYVAYKSTPSGQYLVLFAECMVTPDWPMEKTRWAKRRYSAKRENMCGMPQELVAVHN